LIALHATIKLLLYLHHDCDATIESSSSTGFEEIEDTDSFLIGV
jgi:hypothetical protein